MKIIADHKILQECFEQLSKIPYAGRGPVQSSFLIVFDENKLEVFVDDGYVAIKKTIPTSEKIKITGAGKFMVKAYILNELIKSFSDTVEISLPEEKVVCLNSGNSKNQINLISSESWSEFPHLSTGVEIKISADQIRSINNQVAFAAEKQEAREIYQGINFRTKDGILAIAATDNQRIAYKKISLNTSVQIDATIPARSFAEIYRQITIEPTQQEIVFIFEETQLSIQLSPNVTIVSQLSQENYPDVGEHINLIPMTTVTCDKKQLIRALNRISIVCDRELLPSTKITISSNQISLASPKNMQTGFSEEIIEAQVNGKTQSASLRIKFILQAIQSIEGERIKIEFSADNGAIIIHEENKKDIVHLILPFWEH